jgi:hypothetical protein
MNGHRDPDPVRVQFRTCRSLLLVSHRRGFFSFGKPTPRLLEFRPPTLLLGLSRT